MYHLSSQACVTRSEWFSTVSFSRKADDVLHVQQIYIDKSTCSYIIFWILDNKCLSKIFWCDDFLKDEKKREQMHVNYI